MDPKNPFLPYTRPEPPRELPAATAYELHVEPPPPLADALDLMSRRLSDMVPDPDMVTNVAPHLEGEGQHAHPEAED